GGVGGGQGLAGGGEDLQHLLPGAGAVLPPFGGGGAVDELHGDEDLVVDGADVVDDDDVRGRQARHRLCLRQEAGGLLGGGAAGAEVLDAQELEGDLAVQLGIVGGVDDPHAAGADEAEDDVATYRLAARETGRVVSFSHVAPCTLRVPCWAERGHGLM